MNLQGLRVVEDYKFFIDLAFRKATEKSSAFRGSSKLKGTRIEKSIKIELVKIDAIKDVINDRMTAILKSFPDIEQMPEFYSELIKCTMDYVLLKKSLGAVNWARGKSNDLHSFYTLKIRKCMDLNKINGYRKEFYGRISSVMRQIRSNLVFLESARRVMKEFPSIKTGTKTIAIAGFPNVGKTTLLFKLTGSKPDIQPYAFTTKGINVGYIEKGKEKIQVLDTPGTLNRIDKMNNIEKVAFLALKLLAEKIIYVFDATEPYPMQDQDELYKVIMKMKKPTMVYLSKTDILEKENIEEFGKKHKFMSAEEIVEEIKKSIA